MATTSSETSLVRKSLLMVLLMLGGCVAFVGTLSIVVSVAIGKSGKSSDGTASGDGPVLVPANKLQGTPMSSPAASGGDTAGNPRLGPRGAAFGKPNQVL